MAWLKSIFIKGTLFMSASIRMSSVAILDSKLFKYFEGLDTASALATITKEKFI